MVKFVKRDENGKLVVNNDCYFVEIAKYRDEATYYANISKYENGNMTHSAGDYGIATEETSYKNLRKIIKNEIGKDIGELKDIEWSDGFGHKIYAYIEFAA